MDLALYRLLAQQLSPSPDLTIIQQGLPLPEEWPVVLERIETYRKQVQYFTVTDGSVSVICTSTVPDLYDRITGTELGTIIHLLGAKTFYHQQHKRYVTQIEDFATLKQYDEHLRMVQEAEARRQADLADLNHDLYRQEHPSEFS